MKKPRPGGFSPKFPQTDGPDPVPAAAPPVMLQTAVSPGARRRVMFRPARLEDAAALIALRTSALRGVGEAYSSEQIAVWSDATSEAELRDAIGDADKSSICAMTGDGANQSCVGYWCVSDSTTPFICSRSMSIQAGSGAALAGRSSAPPMQSAARVALHGSTWQPR